MEYRRFAPGQSDVSTFAFHEHRERAPHLEQPIHRGRLHRTAQLTHDVVDQIRDDPRDPVTIVDLGCGDGGLLSLLRRIPGAHVYGYDFQPSNVEGWTERSLLQCTRRLNFIAEWDEVRDADIYVCTEVLEHLEDPHELVRWVAARNAWFIASSPVDEHAGSIDGCHNWAWDADGYRALLEQAGFTWTHHEFIDRFQIIVGKP